MDTGRGAQLASLLHEAFELLIDEVLTELSRRGHPGLSVANEFAMQAVDAGATNAAALSRSLGVTRQAAAKTIATLEGLGYVVRASDEADGRRKDLQLTEVGRRAIAIGSEALDRIRDRWVDSIGTPEASAAEQAFRALADDLRRERSRSR